MKVYLSADIEGVAGITSPEECDLAHADNKYFKEQMTLEVKAACEGAIAAGATSIWVKDAHWTGRNIDPRALPECVRVVRGWTGHPYSMMAELDASFAAVLFIGYHARAGSGGNPLAHTMSSRIVDTMRINGSPISEFVLNTFTATSLGVPVAFLSGDEALCSEVRAYNEAILTYAPLRGVGTGTVSVHPDVAIKEIRKGVETALRRSDLARQMRALPQRFKVEIDYVKPRDAYGMSFYPGAALVADRTVSFESGDWLSAVTMIKFCLTAGG
jgi:D-amino peptidase